MDHLSRLALAALTTLALAAGCRGGGSAPESADSSTAMPPAESRLSGDPGNEAGLTQYAGLLPYAADPVVIPAGSPDEWDQYMRELGNVLYDPEETNPYKRYKAFYSGHRGNYVADDVYIGYAYSADGINWTKYGRIMDRALEDPYVLKVGATYYLYAEDKEDVPFRDIRRYHSSDCETWIGDGDVLEPRAGGVPVDWEAETVSSPVVWTEGETWYLLYEGTGSPHGTRMGLATSTDGANWTRAPINPVFGPAASGAWDDKSVVCDDLVKVGGTYYLLYHGAGAARLDPTEWWVGIASSPDLYNWTRSEHNPITTHTDTMMLLYDTEYVLFALDGITWPVNQATGIGRYHLAEPSALPLNTPPDVRAFAETD